MEIPGKIVRIDEEQKRQVAEVREDILVMNGLLDNISPRLLPETAATSFDFNRQLDEEYVDVKVSSKRQVVIFNSIRFNF